MQVSVNREDTVQKKTEWEKHQLWPQKNTHNPLKLCNFITFWADLNLLVGLTAQWVSLWAVSVRQFRQSREDFVCLLSLNPLKDISIWNWKHEFHSQLACILIWSFQPLKNRNIFDPLQTMFGFVNSAVWCKVDGWNLNQLETMTELLRCVPV